MSDAQSLIAKRDRVKGTISRAKQYAESISDTTAIEALFSRLQSLEEAWVEFKQIEDDLLLDSGQTSSIEEFETKYLDTKALFTRAISKLSESIRPSTLENQTNQPPVFNSTLLPNVTVNAVKDIRLPRLNVPYFTGDFKEWPTFFDLFDASVNKNESLTSSQKCQYLMGLLKGEAATTVRHLKISDANYNEALTRLEKRYNRKGHIVSSLIKTFLDQPSASQASSRHIRSLADVTDEVIRGLKALGGEAEMRDVWLIHIALNKVDPDTRQAWKQETRNNEFPQLQTFIDFLNNRWEELDASSSNTKRVQGTARTLLVTPNVNAISCPLCNQSHHLMSCPTFISYPIKDRRDFVFRKSCCYNCLKKGHSVKHCSSKNRCQKCRKSHHSLLHENSPNSSSQTAYSSQVDNAPSTQYSSNGKRQSSSGENEETTSKASAFNSTTDLSSRTPTSVRLNSSLLPTVKVNVHDSCGIPQSARALLDSGSQISFVTESFTQRLHLKREYARISVCGLGSIDAGTTRGQISIKVSSHYDKSSSIHINAFIMARLTSHLPSFHFDPDLWTYIKDLNLADPSFSQPEPIDIIIGAEHFFEILCPEKIFGPRGYPVAQKTIFGWVLAGNMNSVINNPKLTLGLSSFTDIDKTLRRFWETEEGHAERLILSKEELLCEQHFKSTFHRNDVGRYVVSLPFKQSPSVLGKSEFIALQRLRSMEKKFSANTKLWEKYVDFMREYEEMGHMQLISEESENVRIDKSIYLPHHAVFKQDGSQKIRVVFDGSAKTSSGLSLNECLMVGPTIQRDLISIIISFRKHQIAIAADLEKMYRQVQLATPDREYHRVLWREDTTLPAKHYRLTTVTYGTASAPFLATRVLHQIAQDNKQQYPTTSSRIENCFYVDDLLTSCDSVDEAIQTQRELSTIFDSSGFALHKWKSNSHEFITNLVAVNKSNTTLSIDIDKSYGKVLGLLWDPNSDTFSFSIKEIANPVFTKRELLSESSKIFDPLGWLSPFTIVIKTLFQNLWLQPYGWDDSLPHEVINKWRQMREEFHPIAKIKISRCLHFNHHSVHLYGFSDAAEGAYAAVVYSSVFDSKGEKKTNLIMAKCRVAPLKQVSLPRLELCGAVLLARLMAKVKDALNSPNIELYAWTDSEIVLCWLSDVPRRWNSYVANRTSEILEVIPRNRWNHIASKQNPADCATRGLTPSQLANHATWWNGPQFLTDRTSINTSKDISSASEKLAKGEERKKFCQMFHARIQNDTLLTLTGKYSSWCRLLRILSTALRYLRNLQANKQDRLSGFITTQELRMAAQKLFRWVQQSEFEEDIKCLVRNQQLQSKSKLKSLSPFIDHEGILRVGGRLQNAPYNYEIKHPIILPKNHKLTSLIISNIHERYLHPSASVLVSIARQSYWIIGVRTLAKKLTHSCIKCFKQKSKSNMQLMGSLPMSRVTPGRPFLRTGVDYAGPFKLHIRRKRGAVPVKGYIAIFICMVVKAIHIELVTDLSTEAFLAAFRRFTSRRGIPVDVYSDNGSNFVGASRRLSELHALLMSRNHNALISNSISQIGTNWHFIPPAAPHFGGIWESAVKLVKTQLQRVLGESIPTHEEMNTLLTQIEAIVNSRPLYAISADPEDFDTLTPAHFLIGEPLCSIPEPTLTSKEISPLQHWQHVQAMVQGFWKRWKRDYLTTLQQRPKWQQPQASLKEGDLVVIEAEAPPTKWLLGRISKVHKGKDNLVRVATVKTKHGECRRPIVKLHRLPIA